MILPSPRRRRPPALDQLLAEPLFEVVPLAMIPHAKAVPLGVMVRGTLEWLLDAPTLQQLLHHHAPDQYTRELTLDALVGLLIQVSAGTRRSVYAAYKADQVSDHPTITTSFQAVYAKLGRLQPALSEAVVRYSAGRCSQLLNFLPTARDEPLPNYRLRILDGNVLAGTEHRLTALRKWLNACLPGKSLVVYEPGLGLVTDVVLCEDAYTQERALLADILPRLAAQDLVVADRNFCTTRMVFVVHRQSAKILVRQHLQNLPCEPIGPRKPAGVTATGQLYENPVRVTDPQTAESLELRRIEIHLVRPTRDGDNVVSVLTNLPAEVSAVQIAELYLERWTIERHFQFLTESLHCELPGLGKPRAALFGFAMALVAANVLAVVRGSIRSVFGRAAEQEISGYYLADEIAHDYRTLMKYLPAAEWKSWRGLSGEAMSRLLPAVAQHVNLPALTRSQRGPKKPPKVKPIYDPKHKHYATARLIQQTDENDSC